MSFKPQMLVRMGHRTLLRVANMYNIQSEHKYVTLSSIAQLVNCMFRPLYLAIIRLYLTYRRLYYIISVSNGRRDMVYNGT